MAEKIDGCVDVTVGCEYNANQDSFRVSMVAESVGLRDSVDIPRSAFLSYLDELVVDLKNVGMTDDAIQKVRATFEREYHVSLIWE